MNEPTSFRAGDTTTWTEEGGDYKASAGWTLKYALRNSSASINISSAADGDNHKVTLIASTTAAYEAGIYQYQAYVEDSSNARHTLYTGTIEILQNLVTASSIDTRSHVRKVFDALKSAIEGRATKSEEEIIINGKSIRYLKPAELRREYLNYKRYVDDEEAAERIERGAAAGRKVLARIDSVTG